MSNDETTQTTPRRPRRRLLGCLLVPLLLLAAAGGFFFFRQAQQGHSFRESLRALGESSEDAATGAKVKTALALSKSISAFDIDVTTKDGVVTLRGEVPSVELKELAEALAADTTGVVRLASELTVDLAALPDPELERLNRRVADLELAAAVSGALRARPDLYGTAVEVEAADGVVTVTGEVATFRQLYDVEGAIRGVDGVARIDTRLTVAAEAAEVPEVSVDAAELRRRILVAFHESGAIADTVSVTVEEGRALLAGTVGSKAERVLAETLARGVERVLEVTNDLEVAAPAGKQEAGEEG